MSAERQTKNVDISLETNRLIAVFHIPAVGEVTKVN